MESLLSKKSGRAALATLGVAALVGGTFLLGRTTASGETATPALDQAFVQSVMSRDTGAATTGLRADDSVKLSAGSSGETAAASAPQQSMPDRWPGACAAPLPVVFDGGKVSLAATGLAPKLLGPTFTLTSVSVRMEGQCGEDGKPRDARAVMETSWTHTETGFPVTMRQAVTGAADTPGNFAGPDHATFTDDGFDYAVFVNAYSIMPMPADLPKPAVGGGASIEPAGPAFAPGGDPRAAAVLEAAITDLAPDFPSQCFAREVAGDWSDLARLGVGDPRPALPAGVSLQSSSIRFVQPVAAGCATTAVPAGGGLQFFANFSGGTTNISLNASAIGEQQGGWPGSASDNHMSWMAHGVQFSVSGDRDGKGLGSEILGNIARAMDPRVADACFLRDQPISEKDLAGLGLGKAAAPGGWTLLRANGSSSTTTGNCTDPSSANYGGVNFNWTFIHERKVIDASIMRYGPKTMAEAGGIASDFSLDWNDGKGTQYHVGTWSGPDAELPSRDDLIAVAKSMDPQFDASKLRDGAGGMDGTASSPPMPRK